MLEQGPLKTNGKTSDDDDVSLSNENLLVEVKGARMLDTDDLCLSRTTYAKHEVDMLNGTKK